MMNDTYLFYMKIVTDSFVEMMQLTDKIVVWDGELSWFSTKSEEIYRDGNKLSDIIAYNSNIAINYLKTNSMSYDVWINNFNNFIHKTEPFSLSNFHKKDRLFYEIVYENDKKIGVFKEILNPIKFIQDDDLLTDEEYIQHHNFRILKN